MINPPTGRRLGKYEIAAELGRGGFATVYRARDATLGREIALKALHPQLLADPEFGDRFLREARTLAGLRHPHIVTVYEAGEADGRLYIAMELARGPDLGAALKERGQLPWDEALALLKPVCEALDYAHRQGVVHRDLKPANILLDAERGPMLTDFGFARLMASHSASLSLSGGIVGTPAYIAPEVWAHDAATPAADVYALGCIAHELLTGQVLFPGTTPMQVMHAHDQGPQLPPVWPDGVPVEVETVLARALARGPAARYPNAMALWHALAGLAAADRATRQAQEQAALAAQWRAETETAMRAGQWSAARMALGRWQAAAPDDPAAHAARAEIERNLAPPPLPDPQARSRFDNGARRRIPGWAWSLAVLGVLGMILLAVAWWLPAAQRSMMEATMAAVGRATATAEAHATGAAVRAGEMTPVATRMRQKDGATMVYVPEGEFLMGSPEGEGDSDERPQHPVTLDAFWIDRTEVTNAQHARCVAAGACQASHCAGDSDFNADDQPVVCVTWYQAEAYCAWAGGRLPTEAEWEKAARGTDGRTYPWGSQFDGSRVNFCDRNCEFDWKDGGANDGYARTAPVGSYPSGASPYGALDMAGNVWEWVADWYATDYYGHSPRENPTGPESGDARVLRGGSWNYFRYSVRAAYRFGYVPDNRSTYYGFRCAASTSSL